MRVFSCLLYVYNTSWRNGEVPASYKDASKPNKQPSDLSSSRPVSLTSCFDKVSDRMVLHKLDWWLEGHGAFAAEMTGFRRHCSAMDSVLDLVTSVEQAENQKKIVMAVFLDVKTAYNTVSHPFVLHELLQEQVFDRMFLWLADFLRDTTLCSHA
ncbi:uncharacterized protein LOC135384403 [Ornithodoros turicata]|uniref:uncharacterized protein LOC135384403 n=1 Tax=Ornithodoros turicata TaxID=34597 RepID=UPI003138EBDF